MASRVISKQKRQDYFVWLCEQIHAYDGKDPYLILAKELHKIEFTWCVPNDDNRAEDGIQLRKSYGVPFDGPCSVLEMLIALARRIDFDLSIPDDNHDYTPKYFWEMIDNLGLTRYSDAEYSVHNREYPLSGIIRTLLERAYCSNGKGGLFPLEYPDNDQRDIEIWYQMNAYLGERYS